MNLYNGKITRRINKWIRTKYVLPAKRQKLQNKEISILCNNCTGGFIYHDLGLRFDSPTINLFFHELDFFEFIEHFDYYVDQQLIQILNPKYDKDAPDYPVAVLKGGEKFKDIELHFLHYKSFDEANSKWEKRKKRLHLDRLYVIWTFMGMEQDDIIYKRAQSLPVENKVIFVNHPVDKEKYPDFYYIKGFEHQIGTGQLGEYMNLKGERYYDQFDYVKWINNGLCLEKEKNNAKS